jgi:hypothetical protein
MKAFVSSEMGTTFDLRRRQVAVQALKELAHEPVFFEAQPARPLPKGVTMDGFLRRLVQRSDVLLAIVDDSVSAAMSLELDAASEELGEGRIFYYFTSGRDRDESAQSLWDEVKDSNKLATFASDHELGIEIKRSIGSYADDVLQEPANGPEVLLEAKHSVGSDELEWWDWELEAGDVIDATLTGDDKFYATLADADGFVRLHEHRRSQGLETGTAKSAHHLRHRVEEDGTYYLMIRTSAWLSGKVSIRIKVVVR